MEGMILTESKKTITTQKSLLDFFETKVDSIKIKDVVIKNRIRKRVNRAHIQELAESIADVGLLNPISITKNNKLIAGFHRIKACETLGWEEVPCIIVNSDNSIDLQILEIDENLMGPKLTALEEAEHLALRKKLYEEKFPDTKKGAYSKQANRDSSGKILPKTINDKLSLIDKPSFTEDTSSKTNKSKRTIERGIQIANNIDPEVKEEIWDTKLEDHKTDLLKISKLVPEKQKKVVEKIKKKEAKRVRDALVKIREEENENKPKPEVPKGEFELIYADPPWQYNFTESLTRSIEKEYSTMTLEEIKKLEIPSSKDCILFLWCPAPKLYPEGMEVIKAWGFEYKTCMVWVKDRIGMGYYARNRHEFLLIATKGSPGTPKPKNRPDSIINAKRGKHSKKPEITYKLIEQMYPKKKKIELFARNERKNWNSWGNEVES